VQVTYGTPKGEILLASLEDVSASGARIHAQTDLAATSLQVGAELRLSIPLADNIHIEAVGEIRHMGPRTIGLKFTSSLPEPVQATLSRWVFRHREDDQERLAQRLELVQQGERRNKPGNLGGILLVSGDAELEETLKEVLSPIQSLYRITLSAQALKDALASGPFLALFHVSGGNLDQRRRLKALVELANPRVPVLLLGTQMDGADLFELSGAWKTASAMVWSPSRGAFLQRLAQGIIRRHTQGGDGPLAPAERDKGSL